MNRLTHGPGCEKAPTIWAIFITDKNIQSVYLKTNLELKNIDEWMNANKITVNSAKTKYLLFTPRKINYSIAKYIVQSTF